MRLSSFKFIGEENLKADKIAWIAFSKQTTHDEGLIMDIQTRPSIKDIQVLPVESKDT